MKKIIPFFPSNDPGLAIWSSNLKAAIAANAAQIPCSPAEMTILSNSCDSIGVAIKEVDRSRHALAEAVQQKEQSISDQRAIMLPIIGRIKSAEGYTEALGKLLGIASSTVDISTDDVKAEITARLTGGAVRIDFKKQNTDGINLYWRSKGTASWSFLARDTRSPYIDHPDTGADGKPVHLEYRAYCVVKDEEVGSPSDIIEVIYAA